LRWLPLVSALGAVALGECGGGAVLGRTCAAP
jgi:hypothetical protein